MDMDIYREREKERERGGGRRGGGRYLLFYVYAWFFVGVVRRVIGG